MVQGKKFMKKVYSFSAFARDFLIFHKNIPAIIASLLHRKISRSFESKIMLTVTAVNGCKYCAWFHSKEAVNAGLNQDEVRRMLSRQFDIQIGDEEFKALNFAVHYAETDQKPDRELAADLYETYGAKAADDIFLKLRMIYFGNLCGNTFEGFLSRLKGSKPEKSFWLSELIIFLIISPLYGLLALLMKNEKGPAPI